jgi:predicted transcriptional regulator of viral defense system
MVPKTESYRKGLTPAEAFFLSTLARAGKAIFSMSDARQVLAAKTRRTLSLLSKKKWILRLRRGLYVIVPIDAGVRGSESFIVHDFVIAAHLASPYYVGFWSALNHHGLTDQIPRTVFVATTKPRKPLKILTSIFRFVQLAPRKFIGIETASFDGAEVRLSSKEKTLVDCLDHPELSGGIEEVARAIFFNHGSLDWSEVRKFGLEGGNVAVFKRLGFILERCGLFETYRGVLTGVALTTGYPKLDTIGPAEGKVNERWKLRVNVDLDPERWMY